LLNSVLNVEVCDASPKDFILAGNESYSDILQLRQ
jgi:hypothetical protein